MLNLSVRNVIKLSKVLKKMDVSDLIEKLTVDNDGDTEAKSVEVFIDIMLGCGDAEQELCELIDAILETEGISDNPDPRVVVRAFMKGFEELKEGSEDIITFFKQAFNSAIQ